MKINWGTKLVFFALLFMTFIVTLVVIISREDVSLVTSDYYEKGLQYQSQIDNSLLADSFYSVKLTEAGMEVIPTDKIKDRRYSVFYYRPSDQGLDQEFQDSSMPGKKAVYDLSGLVSGKWTVGIFWNDSGKEYRIERNLER